MITREIFLKEQLGTWYDALSEVVKSSYINSLAGTLEKLRSSGVTVYPNSEDVFKAFKLTQIEDVKVVILGQDPYHDGSAHGLAFSTIGDKCPPSLRNILKEVESDIYDNFNINISAEWNLSKWAAQGVLLLNTALTVEKGKPESHLELWNTFTIRVLNALKKYNRGVVYLLWGKKAQAFRPLIDMEYNYVLEAAHPSPFSAHNGFLGCKHFSKTNDILKTLNKTTINW